MGKIDFTVKKIRNKWRTVDKKNGKKFTIEAKKRDEISWTADGSDISFQFPDLFSRRNNDVKLKDGKSIKLKVAPNARPGVYTYAAFIHKDEVFARGESPPTIIIRD